MRDKQYNFWKHAVRKNTLRRDSPGCKLRKAVFDLMFGRGAFRGFRTYEDKKTGEKRETIEIYFKDKL